MIVPSHSVEQLNTGVVVWSFSVEQQIPPARVWANGKYLSHYFQPERLGNA